MPHVQGLKHKPQEKPIFSKKRRQKLGKFSKPAKENVKGEQIKKKKTNGEYEVGKENKLNKH